MIRLDSVLTLYHVVYEKKESLLRMLQLSRNMCVRENPSIPYTEKAPLRKLIYFWGCQLRYKSSSLELIITCCKQKRTYQVAKTQE